MKTHDFYTGKAYDAYNFFGAHIEKGGVRFRTYAPSARRVCLIGEFNQWNEQVMIQENLSGIYELFIENATEGMMYKYKIYGTDNSCVDHCDPFGFSMELRPNSASIIRSLDYVFHDKKWMDNRCKNYDSPLNIYELHAGSWKKPGDGDCWYTYDELAEHLIPYVKENGYTHIEFLPLSEHPADCSWGYQNTGFFSPTSRYGTPEQLMKLVDACHQAGIGVIMDIVLAHFAIDDYGLKHYDGKALYEYPDNDVGISEWGSYNFNYARGETRSFLQSAANYWLDKYHFDGIRMDAVSRVIYWMGDENRGVNEWGIEFLRVMNEGIHKLHPTAMLIAEDSTHYEKVCAPTEYDGLGFDYKWDMGWMNDTLEYFKLPPEYRRDAYHKLTFSMLYFYRELYILALSHDEVVHGKATIIQKMWGQYEDKFPQARAFYMYMYTHPGKKLNFMGNEFGQFREWDETREPDYDILKYPLHDAFHHFMMDLHHLYIKTQELYDKEYNSDYFKWLEVHGEEKCIYAYRRGTKEEGMIIILNFSNQRVVDYPIRMEADGIIEECLNSDWEQYGGATKREELRVEVSKDSAALFTVPAFSGQIYRMTKKKTKKTRAKRR